MLLHTRWLALQVPLHHTASGDPLAASSHLRHRHPFAARIGTGEQPSHAIIAAAVGTGTLRSATDLWPEFFDWVNGTGMDTSDIAIEVAPVDLGLGELGLVAKSDLEAGDILAWAPTRLLFTKDKAVALWGPAVEEMPERLAVLLLLIHERFVHGDSSAWKTYFTALPNFMDDVSGPSFLWTPEEQELLLGSDAYGASIAMRDYILNEFEEMRSGLFEQRPQDFPAEAFSRSNFLWAAAVVSSRAYGDDVEGSNLALVPLVDFLNHKANTLQLTRFSNGIVAYAHQKYAAGEQVFVNYGGKNNAQLLSQYGFVDDDNPDEAIFLRMGTHFHIEEGPLADAKRLLLGELFGEDVDVDSAILQVRRQAKDWQGVVLPTARILALTSEDVVPANVQELRAPQNLQLEAAAWGLIGKALELRADEYPVSLAEEKQQLNAQLPERNAYALRLCISEQELIAVARSHASEKQAVALTSLRERSDA